MSDDEGLIYGVAKDVTDRKRSEERLRESERKYRDLVETSSDLIWSVDKRGRFTFVNRAARRIYGYEPEEMLGRPIADFETDEQRLKDEDAFRGVLKGTPLFNYETRHIRKDGRPVDLSVNAIVLHDDDGAVLGATGTATDVTDRKRFETRQAAVAELGRRALEGVGPTRDHRGGRSRSWQRRLGSSTAPCWSTCPARIGSSCMPERVGRAEDDPRAHPGAGRLFARRLRDPAGRAGRGRGLRGGAQVPALGGHGRASAPAAVCA